MHFSSALYTDGFKMMPLKPSKTSNFLLFGFEVQWNLKKIISFSKVVPLS